MVKRQLALALLWIYVNTIFSSYSGVGIQAILLLYLENFVRISSKTSQSLQAAYVVVYNAVAPIGGYIADNKWSNYRTQVFSSFVWVVGVSLWMLTTVPGIYNHVLGNPESAGFRALSLFAIFLVAAGSGLLQPLQSVFIADQFDGQDEVNSKQLKRSFAIYYFFCNVGNVAGEFINPALRHAQQKSDKHAAPWAAAAAITGTCIFALLALVAGAPFYRPDRKSKAKLIEASNVNDAEAQPERLVKRSGMCAKLRLDQIYSVEEWNHIRRIALVFAPIIMFWALYNQQNSSWVQQGTEMDSQICLWRHACFTVSPDAMPSFNDLLDLLIIPFLEVVVYPLHSRAFGHSMTSLAKISCGMFATFVSFACAGVLQLYVEDANAAESQISIIWQWPQYVAISFGEIFVSVAGLEFAYTQSPPTLRSSVTAMWYIAAALGNLLFSGLNQTPLGALNAATQFFVYSGLTAILTACFMCIATRYQYLSKQELEVETVCIATSYDSDAFINANVDKSTMEDNEESAHLLAAADE